VTSSQPSSAVKNTRLVRIVHVRGKLREAHQSSLGNLNQYTGLAWYRAVCCRVRPASSSRTGGGIDGHSRMSGWTDAAWCLSTQIKFASIPTSMDADDGWLINELNGASESI
jgi:hypothetical protein